MKNIILASGSPRRKQILELAEINFTVMIIPTDESFPENLSHLEAAMHIAKNKAVAVRSALQSFDVIIAADTIVSLDGNILGKPVDRNDAIAMLSKLSGNTHQVITGVSIFKKDREFLFADITEVDFKPLSQGQIEYYVDVAKPFDKAGAYAIQEWIGLIGIKAIRGDYYNVMGLPLNRIFDILNNQ